MSTAGQEDHPPSPGTFLSAGPAAHAVVDLSSPIVHGKAIKNAAELAGMREAHLRDAVAICDFLTWLENKVRAVSTDPRGRACHTIHCLCSPAKLKRRVLDVSRPEAFFPFTAEPY